MKKKEKKVISRSDALIEHINKISKEVSKWPMWKQVLLRPRKPRNGFKV